MRWDTGLCYRFSVRNETLCVSSCESLTLITARMAYYLSVTSRGTLCEAGTRKEMVTQTPLWSTGLVDIGLF